MGLSTAEEKTTTGGDEETAWRGKQEGKGLDGRAALSGWRNVQVLLIRGDWSVWDGVVGGFPPAQFRQAGFYREDSYSTGHITDVEVSNDVRGR